MASTDDVGRWAQRAAALALGLALGCSPSQRDPDDSPGTVVVEFRVAQLEPDDELTPAIWPQTGETLYLHPGVVAGNADIAEASTGFDGIKDVVLIRFTKSGGEKMSRLYDDHKGKPLAILIDGKVVCASVMHDRITRNTGISGRFTREEVDQIVTQLNRR